MLRHHVSSSRVVVVLVHLNHLERVHDATEECVVELDAPGVAHLLRVLQDDGDRHLALVHGVLGLEHRVLNLMRQVENHSVEGSCWSQGLSQLLDQVAALVLAVHGWVEPDLILVHAFVGSDLQPDVVDRQ